MSEYGWDVCVGRRESYYLMPLPSLVTVFSGPKCEKLGSKL